MLTLPKKIGEKLDVTGANGATGYVLKIKQDLFCLTDHGNRYRNRWGTAKEILADLDHFQTYGQLPPPSGQRW